jgi:hypothetical protein
MGQRRAELRFRLPQVRYYPEWKITFLAISRTCF